MVVNRYESYAYIKIRHPVDCISLCEYEKCRYAWAADWSDNIG
jgi:hypothetical protein